VALTFGGGRGAWAQNPLSLEYFSTNNAGVEFFDKLEELRLRPAAHTDLLEVYHACLLLGFEGKYALSDPRQLRALIESIARDLERLRATPADLSPEGYLPDEVAARIRESIPLGVIAAIIVGVLFVLFLILHLLGNGQAESVAAQLRALV